TKPMRRMLMSRSSFENPNPFERLVRTMSPSRISTFLPSWRKRSDTGIDRVDLPAPERPVNQRVNPRDMGAAFALAWRLMLGPAAGACQGSYGLNGDLPGSYERS